MTKSYALALVFLLLSTHDAIALEVSDFGGEPSSINRVVRSAPDSHKLRACAKTLTLLGGTSMFEAETKDFSDSLALYPEWEREFAETKYRTGLLSRTEKRNIALRLEMDPNREDLDATIAVLLAESKDKGFHRYVYQRAEGLPADANKKFAEVMLILRLYGNKEFSRALSQIDRIKRSRSLRFRDEGIDEAELSSYFSAANIDNMIGLVELAIRHRTARQEKDKIEIALEYFQHREAFFTAADLLNHQGASEYQLLEREFLESIVRNSEYAIAGDFGRPTQNQIRAIWTRKNDNKGYVIFGAKEVFTVEVSFDDYTPPCTGTYRGEEANKPMVTVADRRLVEAHLCR